MLNRQRVGPCSDVGPSLLAVESCPRSVASKLSHCNRDVLIVRLQRTQVKGAFMESLVDMDVEALKDAWARRQASAGDGAAAAAAAVVPAAAQQPQQQQPQQQQQPPAAQVRSVVLPPRQPIWNGLL